MGYTEMVPDRETATLLNLFWATRDKVADENRCPTALARDGEAEECVLDAAHIKSDVPHVAEDGYLAPLLVKQATIRAAEELSKQPWPGEERGCGHTAEEHAEFIREKLRERGMTKEVRHEVKRALMAEIFGAD